MAVPEVFECFRCEAYGPGGAALIVECRSDNRDRTIAQVRQIVREHGGYLAARAAVSYLFNEVGQLKFARGTDPRGGGNGCPRGGCGGRDTCSAGSID